MSNNQYKSIFDNLTNDEMISGFRISLKREPISINEAKVNYISSKIFNKTRLSILTMDQLRLMLKFLSDIHTEILEIEISLISRITNEILRRNRNNPSYRMRQKSKRGNNNGNNNGNNGHGKKPRTHSRRNNQVSTMMNQSSNTFGLETMQIN